MAYAQTVEEERDMMQANGELTNALNWLEEHAGLTGLRRNAYEGRWEIVKIETVRDDPGGIERSAYGFRCRYNDVVVGGLCELEVAQVLMKHKLVGSYVEQELGREVW